LDVHAVIEHVVRPARREHRGDGERDRAEQDRHLLEEAEAGGAVGVRGHEREVELRDAAEQHAEQDQAPEPAEQATTARPSRQTEMRRIEIPPHSDSER